MPPQTQILICHRSAISHIGTTLLQGLPQLKHISVLAVGTERIDTKLCKKHNITVSYAKGCNSIAVAEHIRAMILALSKKLAVIQNTIKATGSINILQLQGVEIHDKTIGIIGLGEIGSHVAKIAHAFSMKIIGIDPKKPTIEGVIYDTMATLLQHSDIIVICTPLTPETTNLISSGQIKQMKPEAIIINCAREQIVNKNDIIKAIKEKRIAGYGVETDTIGSIEPNDPYLTHPQILVTPHIARNTKETKERTYHITLSNIKAYLNNSSINIVND